MPLALSLSECSLLAGKVSYLGLVSFHLLYWQSCACCVKHLPNDDSLGFLHRLATVRDDHGSFCFLAGFDHGFISAHTNTSATLSDLLLTTVDVVISHC